MISIGVTVIMIALLMCLVAVLPRLLLKRAVRSVISIFIRKSAVTISSAKTIDELGLKPASIMERFYKLRDYKPYALHILMKANIIKITEDGKLFLSEEQLTSSLWSHG